MNSGAYQAQVATLKGHPKVISIACPLFVPLVEEGLINDKATELIAKKYLSPFEKTKIDVLILGCTHFPLIKKVISKSLDKKILLIDSSKPTVQELKKVLTKNNLLSNKKSKHKFFVTDIHPKMKEMINLLFEDKLPGKLEKIELA